MKIDKYKVSFIIVSVVIFIASGYVMANVLCPPLETSEKFVREVNYESNLIDKFVIIGDWSVSNYDGNSVLIGKSTDSPISVKSIDHLSKSPKSFIFNFFVKNTKNIYGFIYGKSCLIVKDGYLYKAKFNNDLTKLTDLVNTKRAAYYSDGLLSNTVELSTGYDPLGGSNIQCVIYINGIGELFECSGKDDQFGVYLAPENEITIGGFKWDTSNH